MARLNTQFLVIIGRCRSNIRNYLNRTVADGRRRRMVTCYIYIGAIRTGERGKSFAWCWFGVGKTTIERLRGKITISYWDVCANVAERSEYALTMCHPMCQGSTRSMRNRDLSRSSLSDSCHVVVGVLVVVVFGLPSARAVRLWRKRRLQLRKVKSNHHHSLFIRANAPYPPTIGQLFWLCISNDDCLGAK